LLANVVKACVEVDLLFFDVDVSWWFICPYKLKGVDDRFAVEERQHVVAVVVRDDVLARLLIWHVLRGVMEQVSVSDETRLERIGAKLLQMLAFGAVWTGTFDGAAQRGDVVACEGATGGRAGPGRPL